MQLGGLLLLAGVVLAAVPSSIAAPVSPQVLLEPLLGGDCPPVAIKHEPPDVEVTPSCAPSPPDIEELVEALCNEVSRALPTVLLP